MATIKKRRGKRGVSYQVIIRIKGHPPIYETFRRYADAKEFAAKTEAEIRQGENLRKNVCQDFTAHDALVRYFKTVTPKKRPSTQRREKETIKRILEHFASFSLHEITPEMVAEYRDERLHEVSGSTVRQELALLSHLFQVANSEWGLKLANQWRKSNGHLRILVGCVFCPKTRQNASSRSAGRVEIHICIHTYCCYSIQV